MISQSPSPRPCRRRFTRTAVGATSLLLLSLAAACTEEAPSIVGEISVSTPNETVPLARLVEFTTDGPAVATVQVISGDRRWTVSGPDEPTTSHALPVVGLGAARSHAIGVTLRDAAGNERANAATTSFETMPLPADFPPIEVTRSDPERMEPGLTMFSVLSWFENGQNMERGLLVAVDAGGDVVWYYDAPFAFSDFDLTDRGTVLYQGWDQIREVDLTGNAVAAWRATGLPAHSSPDAVPEGAMPIATDVLHHEIVELPSGELVTLGTELREFDDYPTDERDPTAPRERGYVVGDTILQFDRSGATTGEWKLFDLLDPYRIAYDSLNGYYNKDYSHVGHTTRDWSHGNALFHDARDDSYIISLRNQHAVVKIDRASGEIVWILGDHAGWGERWQRYLLEPEGDLVWNYAQHGVKITPHGTLLFFDNGNFKAIPPTPPVAEADNYSRAVEFAIDEEAMTVRQVWAYGGPDEKFFAAFLGDADWLPQTGNVLVTDGGRVVDADGVPSRLVLPGRKFARLVEVTHETPAEPVFELMVDSGEFPGWSIYRAQRIAGLQ